MERGHRWRAVAGDIGLAMAREMDSGTSAAVATAELRDVLDLDRASVLQLVPGGMLEVIAEAGPKAPSVQFREAEKGTVGKALREKRPILGRQGSIRRDSDRRSPQHSAAEVAVPLIFGGKAWGAISCTAGDRPLDEVDAELVAAVAEHLSASIRTGDLYEQLTQSMIGTAEALAAAMAAKDSYTADHAKSIAKIAVAVARELSLPESAVEDVRYAGVFHDLGKIAMPDSLINKPGPLTPDEFEVIKEHPVIGSEILAPVPYLYGVRSIVRHAHEHWDGSGYPEGLRGGQIPLGARIILAVDAFHAMTSDRPYRRRLSRQDAYAELRRCAGIQFDPEVIEALMSVLMRQDAAADA
jgi:putative nucleotidyltransferase with HDIG domain